MHASLAFVNGAGNKRRSSGSPSEREKLRLLNTLLSTAASRPGGFNSDADDPTNPNEVRERHLKKIKR
jgi:hypothetical protein